MTGSIAAIVTMGFGSFGSASLVVTAGYGNGSGGTTVSGPILFCAGDIFRPGSMASAQYTPGAMQSDGYQPGAMKGMAE